MNTFLIDFVAEFLLPPWILLVSTLPAIILTSCLVTNFDVTYFLLCKLDARNHTLLWIVANLGRVSILLVVSIEAARSVCQIAFLVYILLSRLERITLCFGFFDRRPHRFRFYTSIVGMEFATVQGLLDGATYVAFWLMVCITWIIIRNSPQHLTYSLYDTYSGVWMVVLFMLLALLPFAARQMESYKWAVKQNTQNARQLNKYW